MRGTERMTLYEALQELAPVPDGLPTNLRERREQACQLVYAALRARAPAILKVGHDADDAVATVLMRLIQTGPRGHWSVAARTLSASSCPMCAATGKARRSMP